LLHTANAAVLTGEQDTAVDAITAFAQIAFLIPPFSPQSLIDDWESLLRLWLLGQPVTDVLSGDNDEAIQFIEQAFVYNLPWAMEAVRVRAEVHENPFSDEVKLSDFSQAHAVVALETGTLSIAAATLIQAGFGSRLAAIQAVTSTRANFESMKGLMAWLSSDEIRALSVKPDWPTPESHQLWIEFITGPSGALAAKAWTATTYSSQVTWHDVPMPPGVALRIGGGPAKEQSVFSADYREVGMIGWMPNPVATGVMIATSNGSQDKFDLEYIGPDDMLTS
jgi:hypothetical protein